MRVARRPRAELAARAGTNERYTREWLEQQAVAGYLAVDNPEASAGERRFRLPEGYEAVFVDPESLIGGASMAQITGRHGVASESAAGGVSHR